VTAACLVRPAEVGDAEELRRIHDDALLTGARDHYDAATLRAWSFEGRGLDEVHLRVRMVIATMLVAEAADGSVTGFGEIDVESGELTLLFVDPPRMGQGIGGRLLEGLEQAARAAGVTELSLFAALNAVSFYERFGWRRGAAVEQRIAGRAIPCICMLRDLP